ncbi:MAG: 1-acyl-sn-glycerol-3-phosphate acyltransferase [Bacteroidales bacterium]|nr:1-acyl-sn-glycerol-3-phosphate acyltransferase [Bacteroidales bacterium]
MPVLTTQEIQQMLPGLDSKGGAAIIRALMRFASLDRVNDLYDRHGDLQGSRFADALLRDIGVDYLVGHPERLATLPEGPFITVSNHPFGHIDGIMLIDLFGHLRSDYKVMVNQILSRIRALSPNFIQVVPNGSDPSGAPKTASLTGVRETLSRLREGHPVGFFPSGAVSDLSLRERIIRDRPWQLPVLRLIEKARVPVVPVRFFDRNSLYFYSLGLIDWRVRLVRLCGEVFNKRDHRIRLGIGETITPEQQAACPSADSLGALLRSSVYDMPLPADASFVRRSELEL